MAAIDPSGINQGRNQHPAPNTPDLGDSTKAPSMLSILRRSHARQAERLFTNRSLFEIEPVSTPPKRKLENSEQRPATETQAQRTQTREIAGQRPGPASLTRGNVGNSSPPRNNTSETGLPGCPERIRTLESRDAGSPGKGLTAIAGRLALTSHRRKEWTSTGNGASLSPCRDQGRLALLPRWRWCHCGASVVTALVPSQPKRILKCRSKCRSAKPPERLSLRAPRAARKGLQRALSHWPRIGDFRANLARQRVP